MSTVLAFLAARRKTIAALVGPWLAVASNYLLMPIPHVWWALIVGEATALGVYAVPNTPTEPAPNPPAPPAGP